ncbi:putative leucine-rich repeat receptor-like serine/threonine-protein kinase At2g24130 [Nymphaea colorata]|nr:putative leucine-rich repeat receptor-like serine/threonine-protein kinase At2g24130 [Nymphaea colorata]
MPLTLIISHLLLLLSFHHFTFSLGYCQNHHCSHHDDLFTDRAALLAFKASTFSETNVLSNWTFTDDQDASSICNWIGVTCQDIMLRKRVVNLTLNRKGLRGTISPLISNLSALVTLVLSENELHGVIPYPMSDLKSLKQLSLEGNQLQHRVPDLSSLSGLTYISLANNHFSGEIPRFLFRNCTRLQYLDLSGNKFHGTIPPEIGNSLPVLANLNLYDNLLTGELPASLRNCTCLNGLDIENNDFCGELSADMFCRARSLEYLHLSYNNFRSSEKNTNLAPFFTGLRKCVNLRELELTGIGFRGELPATIGLLLPISLTQLQLGENQLTGELSPSISMLTNLTLLNLSSNLLHGAIPKEIGAMENLERLLLSDNNFTGTIPETMGAMKHLGLLDLSRNMLTGEIPEALSNLTQLRMLYLHGNQLSGPIPATLGKCVNLETLDLSRNRLTGGIPLEVRGLNELKIYLNLSHNLLDGPIPVEISKMDKVQEIDLSYNNLSGNIISQLAYCVGAQSINFSHNLLDGPIPASIGTMQNLLSLDLSFNLLTGDIPVSLQKCTSLRLLNVSYNNLTNMVPSGGPFESLDITSFLHNPLLCGSISGLLRCPKNKRQDFPFLSKKIFALMLATSASATFFVTTICCSVCCSLLKKAVFIARDRIEVGCNLPQPLESKYPRITYAEILEATSSFDSRRLIGTGSYGEVYRAELKDGREVAIKVLKTQGKNSSKSFNRECQVLRNIRHRNLMRIITACSQPDFKALVLPFMAKGNLESHLHPSSDLSLIQRVNICSDVAEGIAYLHHHSPVKVIHCDLKPSNILLNDEMTALVSDFGIARLITSIGEGAATTSDTLPNSTANFVIGSLGYIPPEYGMGKGAATKGDVFSFGILVLEVVTRRKPTDEMFSGGLSLQEWVKRHHYHGLIEDVLDPALLSTGGFESLHGHHHGDPQQRKAHNCRRTWECGVMELMELGLLCTQHSPAARPTMMDAADDLERLKRYLAGDASISFASSHCISSTSSSSTIC